MAIGTTAAILGSAVIGAGASAVAGSKNSKAIRQSTDAQTQSNAQNLALQKQVFDTNRATLNPFVQRGNTAGNAMNALLGLGGSQVQGGPENVGALPGFQQPNGLATMQAPNALAQFGGSQVNPAIAAQFPMMFPQEQGGPERVAVSRVTAGNAGLPYGLGDNFITTGTVNNGLATATGNTNGQVPGTQPGQTAQQAAESAFDIFRNSTGYQFRLGEGMDAVNSGWAGNGMLQSGAALRGIQEYGQNFASNEFNNYMSLLSGQQGTGLQAAGAQAGVGVNYANAASNINAANANALSNAAVARANNSNAMIGGIGNAFGGAFGALAYQPR